MPGQASDGAEFGALVLGFERPTSFDVADLELLRNAAERVAVTLKRVGQNIRLVPFAGTD